MMGEPFGSKMVVDSDWSFGLAQLQNSQARVHLNLIRFNAGFGCKWDRIFVPWFCELNTIACEPKPSPVIMQQTMAFFPRKE